VQFTHRVLAYTTAGLVIWTALRARASGAAPGLARRSQGAIHVVLLQVVLGIATVLLQVPTWLGALHQANAIALLTMLVLVLFETGSPVTATSSRRAAAAA
jgi:cytochrome c oxidase assembly protein subunit 15